MRRIAYIAAMTFALILGGGTAVNADPDFGPGNSQAGPNDGNSKCHPPGQTVEEPGCK